LTQKAWVISLSGIVAVPALLISLVMLVLHPISNDRYIDPMFGHYIAFVGFVAVAVTAVAGVLWFAWLGLVKPLFFPTWHSASASSHRGNGSNTMTQADDLSTPKKHILAQRGRYRNGEQGHEGRRSQISARND
jgi:hypothetical protein